MQAPFHSAHGIMLGSMEYIPSSPDKVHGRYSSAMENAGHSWHSYQPSYFWSIICTLIEWGYVEMSNGIELSLTDMGKLRNDFFIRETL